MEKYSIFLVDVFGVVYDGRYPYPEAIKAVNTLVEAGKHVIFLSNMPRPHTVLEPKLRAMGMKGSFGCFTSGDATRVYLQNHKDKTFYHLGEHQNEDLLRGLDVKTTTDITKAEAVILTLYLEENETDQPFQKVFQQIKARKLPLICANPDLIAPYGQTQRQCAGTFAQQLAAEGVPVLYMGKPAKEFYEIFEKQLMRVLRGHRPEQRGSMLMIGDTLNTDILGAHNFGVDSLHITGQKAVPGSSSLPQPTYAMSQLCL